MSPSASPLLTLLVSAPDRKGLVAGLAQLLYGHGANILDADQHTDPVEQLFFQRIRCDISELHTDRVTLLRGLDEVATRFDMQLAVHDEQRLKKVAVFVSRYDHCLYDLLLRHRSGELRCELACIISNHPDLEPIAQQFGVPYHTLPIDRSNKREQEQRQQQLLRDYDIDLIVLARYMQILSEEFVSAYPARIINIHHSFLPAFAGGRPYHQAYRRGVKIIGATAHYATADLDEGPIIAQSVVPCSHRDSVDDLILKGRDIERIVFARAVRLHLENRILVHANKTVVFD